MFKDVLDALRFVGDAFTKGRGIRAEEREKLAKICEDVSGVLQKYSEAPRDRRASINLCAQLREFKPKLLNLAEGKVAPTEINRLATSLEGVCDAWAKIAPESQPDSHASDLYLDQIVAAAGTFHAYADVVRAG